MTSPSDARLESLFDFDDLKAKFDDIIEFGKHSKVDTGFGRLGADGTIDPEKPVELWITCRMTHMFALASMLGISGTADLAAHGVKSLSTYFKDPEYGGWFAAIKPVIGEDGHGIPVNDRKEAYAHAFVELAANSAVAAGVEGANELLEEAVENQRNRWYRDDEGRVVEAWDRAFQAVEAYRGLNSNMHTVEAYLSTFDVTKERSILDRAMMIIEFVAQLGAAQNWRLPEHFSDKWFPLPDFNSNNPADPFRPFGATPGHGFEWARLMLHARASLIGADGSAPEWLLPAAFNLYKRAAADGWGADGRPGFVYTTDLSGQPVVCERMHWVVCEAIAAATVLLAQISGTGEDADLDSISPAIANDFVRFGVADDITTWWEYFKEHFNTAPGAWTHELDHDNMPSGRTWPDRPDIYHVGQMLLLPMIADKPTFAAALREISEATEPSA